MEPNANRLFWNEDSDGDSLEIITAYSDRMTIITRSKDRPLPHATYLDRTAVEGLHAVLGRWLGLNTEPEQIGQGPDDVQGPGRDTPALRRTAMDMALASGHPETVIAAHLIATHLVHTLACPARDSEACTCGGAVPGVSASVPAEEHRTDTLCSVCGHGEHNQGACSEDTGNTTCSCLASRVVHPRCPVCEHAPHGIAWCGEGGRGLHRCQCLGRPGVDA
jgi:hypothetical protein